MPSPTGIIGFSPSTPAAPSGFENVAPQTDSASPIQHFSFYFPNIAGVNANAGTTANLGQAQQGSLNTYSNSSGVAVSLSNSGMAAKWMCYVANINATGTVIITPNAGTFSYGSTTGASTLSLAPGGDAIILWDGTNWQALLMGTSAGTGDATAIQGVAVSSATPTTGQVLEFTGSQWTPTTPTNGPSPFSRRWAYMVAATNPTTVSAQAVGDEINSQNTGSFNLPFPGGSPNYSEVVWTNTSTSSSAGQQAGLNGSLIWGTGTNLLFETKLALSVITSIRFVVGFFATANGATPITADTLTESYAAFRFSTSASDTDFQCITGNGTTTTVTSSGIAAVAYTQYKFGIKFNDSTPNVVFSINGNVVATNTTHLPLASTGLAYHLCFIPLTSTTEVLYTSWIYLESDT